MIKLKDLLIEAKANDGERYQQERKDAVTALDALRQTVEGFRSPKEKGASGHNADDEKAAANVMAKFVDMCHKLTREWFNMSRKI